MRFLPIAILSIFALAACETVDGFGEDVQSGGEAISDASQDVQSEL
ncbi:MAG: entericidin A/B family lipoprotein [Pseudomonadota bacterium]